PPRQPVGGWPASATQCTAPADPVTAVAALSTAPPTAKAGGFPATRQVPPKGAGIPGLQFTRPAVHGNPATEKDDQGLTAAHCLEGTIGPIEYTSTDLAFIPMFQDNQSPFGTWTVRKAFIDSGWIHCSIPLVLCTTNPNDDYAVLVLNPMNGKDVGDVT